MATSLGIHLQSHGFDYALLDGSVKRSSVKSSGGAVFRPEDIQNSKALGKLIADTIKTSKADQVVVTLPASGVVMRELSLPFADREKVMQVLKFEIESELYHLDFDDVIADFIELSDGRATPTLLVSVLEKERITSALGVLDGASFDPPVVTLSHGSLLTALQALPREGGSVDAPLETYLHVGSESSLLLVLNPDGSLRGSRALPMGWRELTRGTVQAEEVVPEPEAEEASEEAPSSEGESEESEEVEEADVALGGDSSLPFGVDFETALENAPATKKQDFLSRISIEVRRGLAALGSASGPVYLLGASLPGLEHHLQSKLGRDVAPLSLGMAGPDGKEPDEVALGAAMRGLGFDIAAMNFRQEEFRYARGLERIEGPLTLALVGLIVFFAFDLAINLKVAQQRKADAAAIYARADQKVEALNHKVREDDEYPDEWIVKNNYSGINISESGRIGLLNSNVLKAKKQLDAVMGEADLEMPPSSLEAWRRLMNFLDEEMADYDGRWMIEQFSFRTDRGSAGKEAHVGAKFGITLFPDSSGEMIGRFDKIVADLNAQPWTIDGVSLPSTEDVANGGKTGTVAVSIKTIKLEEMP